MALTVDLIAWSTIDTFFLFFMVHAASSAPWQATQVPLKFRLIARTGTPEENEKGRHTANTQHLRAFFQRRTPFPPGEGRKVPHSVLEAPDTETERTVGVVRVGEAAAEVQVARVNAIHRTAPVVAEAACAVDRAIAAVADTGRNKLQGRSESAG